MARDYKKAGCYEDGGTVEPLERFRNEYKKARPSSDDSEDDDKPSILTRAARALSGMIPEKDRYPKPIRTPPYTIGIRG